jgi:hypothetical protein
MRTTTQLHSPQPTTATPYHSQRSNLSLRHKISPDGPVSLTPLAVYELERNTSRCVLASIPACHSLLADQTGKLSRTRLINEVINPPLPHIFRPDNSPLENKPAHSPPVAKEKMLQILGQRHPRVLEMQEKVQEWNRTSDEVYTLRGWA